MSRGETDSDGSNGIHTTTDFPEDLEERSSSTFDVRGVYELLRDTYFLGPMSVGKGGVRKAYGAGKPGTGLRRPSGALYDMPESWRTSVLRKALETEIITRVDGDDDPEADDLDEGTYAATERGLSILHRIMVCSECGHDRVVKMKKSYYQANPKAKAITSEALVTACPVCDLGKSEEEAEEAVRGLVLHSSHGSSYTTFTRNPERVPALKRFLAENPEAEIFFDEKAEAVAAEYEALGFEKGDRVRHEPDHDHDEPAEGTVERIEYDREREEFEVRARIDEDQDEEGGTTLRIRAASEFAPVDEFAEAAADAFECDHDGLEAAWGEAEIQFEGEAVFLEATCPECEVPFTRSYELKSEHASSPEVRRALEEAAGEAS